MRKTCLLWNYMWNENKIKYTHIHKHSLKTYQKSFSNIENQKRHKNCLHLLFRTYLRLAKIGMKQRIGRICILYAERVL